MGISSSDSSSEEGSDDEASASDDVLAWEDAGDEDSGGFVDGLEVEVDDWVVFGDVFPRVVRFLEGSLASRIFRVGVGSVSIASVGGEVRLVADMVKWCVR